MKTKVISIVFCVLLTNWTVSLINAYGVYVGGLFEGDNEDEELAFQLALDKINRENKLPYSLLPLPVRIEPDDIIDAKHGIKKGVTWNAPFTALESTCSILNQGVIGVFSALGEDNSNAVQSLCDAKGIPTIKTTLITEKQPDCCSINIHPHAQVLSKAFSDVVKAWMWNSFTIMYEDQESLPKITEMLKIYNTTGHTVVLRQLYSSGNGGYRQALKEIWRSGQKNFVLDCSIENLGDILQQAQQIGLMTSRHSYIIINLDLHTIELGPYQYGETNITGFQLVDPTNPVVEEVAATLQQQKYEMGLLVEPFNQFVASWKLQSSTALIVDAINLFAISLEDMGPLQAKPISCNSTDTWVHGETIFNAMKMNTREGLTGPIQFDNPTGLRKDFSLNLIELREGGIIKVGAWNSMTGLKISRSDTKIEIEDKESLRNKTFKVMICETKPYGMLKDTHVQLTGNDRYEGFGIDLIHELAILEGFNYTFLLREDGKNGDYNATTKKWIGMIGDVIDGVADLAITDLTITRQRQQFVDFTSPFMNLGIQILYSKPTPEPPSFFTFASPFAVEIWLLLAGAYFGVSVVLFIMARLCQSEWNNPYPCIEEPEYLVNQFSLRNSLWFTLGGLMQQGADVAPAGFSTRLLAGFWWFFTLIMVASYTANLAAFLTTEVSQLPFDNVEELVKRAERLGISYGAKSGGATESFFKASQNQIFKQIGEYMEKNANAMVKKNSDGVAKAEKGKYAFFMESTTINYEKQGSCFLQSVGQPLDEKGYGIAMRKNMPYRGRLSAAVLKLQETGVIDKLERKWWYEKREPLDCEEGGDMPDAPPLNLKHVGGIFWVSVGGTVLAFVLVFLELAIHTLKKYGRTKASCMEEFKEEIKFYFAFQGMVKSVKDKSGDSQSVSSKNKLETAESTPISYGFTTEVLHDT